MYEAEDSHWWYVGLHKLILAVIQKESQRLGRPLDIFDAGCGTGRLCQLVSRQGHRISGCDLSEEALRLCGLRGNKTAKTADLNSIDLESGIFDVITSIDVLYHKGITDDVAVMRRLWKGLRPGGMLILNLLAHDFLWSRHDIAVHTRERYTKDKLCRRLGAAQFSIEQISYRVGLLFPFIASYRLLSRFRRHWSGDGEAVSDVSLPHQLINGLLLKTIELENLWLRISSLPAGSSLFVVARKPR